MNSYVNVLLMVRVTRVGDHDRVDVGVPTEAGYLREEMVADMFCPCEGNTLIGSVAVNVDE